MSRKIPYDPASRPRCANSGRQDDGDSRILRSERGLISMIRIFDHQHARFAVAGSSNSRIALVPSR
jgi:hypothetical protein